MAYLTERRMRRHQGFTLDGRTEEVDVIRHQRLNDEQDEYVCAIDRKRLFSRVFLGRWERDSRGTKVEPHHAAERVALGKKIKYACSHCSRLRAKSVEGIVTLNSQRLTSGAVVSAI